MMHIAWRLRLTPATLRWPTLSPAEAAKRVLKSTFNKYLINKKLQTKTLFPPQVKRGWSGAASTG
jgi:hypothetical protein